MFNFRVWLERNDEESVGFCLNTQNTPNTCWVLSTQKTWVLSTQNIQIQTFENKSSQDETKTDDNNNN